MSIDDVYDDEQLAALERKIDERLASIRRHTPEIVAIDRGEPGGPIRWFVRLAGDEKDFTTIWFTLTQRTLRFETYVMPAPEENERQLYEHVLRRNDRLGLVHFSIGEEDAIFLRGELPLAVLDESALDHVIGTMYATVELTFQPMLHIGFASKLAKRPRSSDEAD